jgi:hypothetical protein
LNVWSKPASIIIRLRDLHRWLTIATGHKSRSTGSPSGSTPFEKLHAQAGIAPADLEITITETPRQNRGFRGQTGDEVGLDYKVDV